MSQDFYVTFYIYWIVLIFILWSMMLFYLKRVRSFLNGFSMSVRYLPRHVREEIFSMVPFVMLGFMNRSLSFFSWS